MKVFVRPTGLYSRAMTRVAVALARYAPLSVEIVETYAEADIVVSHLIGPWDQMETKPEIVIQYCLRSAGLDYERWAQRWRRAMFVWSYFDLPAETGLNGYKFYHSPLGVDDAFISPLAATDRDSVMTSGYVSASIAEAIEEVMQAAWMLDIPIVHLGPHYIDGIHQQFAMRSILGVSDSVLAGFYSQCKWVSGLRHVEGFELPIIEGLCCGARPIVFDRPDMHQWYDGHAVFVPECDGTELVRHLLDVMGDEPDPVTRDERQWAAERFAWEPIVKGFWEQAGA